MAVRRIPAKKKKSVAAYMAPVFWIVFAIGILILFVMNWDRIQKTIKDSQFLDRISKINEDDDPGSPPTDPDTSPGSEITIIVPPPTGNNNPGTAANPPAQPSVPQSQTETVPVEPQPPAPAVQPTPQQPTEQAMRDRSIYLVSIGSDGRTALIKVNRRLPASDSPMTDALNSLLAGPVREEQNRELASFVPDGSRIISATVRESTAYISFNETFQYNSSGREGYTAALRQIIWTATEFPNVENVQILINGERINYQNDGIWIGSPLDRSF